MPTSSCGDGQPLEADDDRMRAQYLLESRSMLLGHHKRGVSVWHRPITWIALAWVCGARQPQNLVSSPRAHHNAARDKNSCEALLIFWSQTAAHVSFPASQKTHKGFSELQPRIEGTKTAGKGIHSLTHIAPAARSINLRQRDAHTTETCRTGGRRQAHRAAL